MLILPPDELQYKCKKIAIAHLNYINNYLRDLKKEQNPIWVFKINKNILKKAIDEIWLHNSKKNIANNILILPFHKANLLCILGLLHSLHQILEKYWQHCAITCLHHISRINYLIGDLLPCWFPYQIESTFIRAHIDKLEKKINQPLGSLVSLKPLAINLCSYSSSIYLANYLPKVNYINFYNVRSHRDFSQLFYHELAHLLLACRVEGSYCVPKSYFELNAMPLKKSYNQFLVESFCDNFSLFIRGEINDIRLKFFFESFVREYSSEVGRKND